MFTNRHLLPHWTGLGGKGLKLPSGGKVTHYNSPKTEVDKTSFGDKSHGGLQIQVGKVLSLLFANTRNSPEGELVVGYRVVTGPQDLLSVRSAAMTHDQAEQSQQHSS